MNMEGDMSVLHFGNQVKIFTYVAGLILTLTAGGFAQPAITTEAWNGKGVQMAKGRRS
jgi:hypothetical protein